MKSLPVVFLDHGEADLQEAITFYESWRPQSGTEFLHHFWETIDWIEWNPLMFLEKIRPFRRALVRRRYYADFFAGETKGTVVVAVLNQRRDPAAIRDLLRSRS